MMDARDFRPHHHHQIGAINQKALHHPPLSLVLSICRLDAETDFGLRLLLLAASSSSSSSSSPALPNPSRVISPLSITYAVALLHRAFGDDSAARVELEELVPALDDPASFLVDDVAGADSDVHVCVANRLFVKHPCQLKQSFLEQIRSVHAAVQSVNFDDGQKSANVINAFIEQETGGKIRDLVTSDTLKDAFALLVNAVYFKAEWLEKFEKNSTLPMSFYTQEGVFREIPFLNEYETHRDYTEDEVFQVLSLPYTDPHFTFVIFLPKLRLGLDKALDHLDGIRFQDLISDLKSVYVNVRIPKMHIEHEVSLKDILEGVGLTNLFTEPLSAMTTSGGVKLSSGVHKSVIDVDEDGTTAASTSVLKTRLEMMIMAEPTNFVADHPFLFAVLHHHRPLFMGFHL